MNNFKLMIFMSLLIMLFVFIGKAVGGQGGMMVALVISLMMNFGAYWFSDKIVLYSYGARPLPVDAAPEIHEIVARLSDRARIPMPKVYIVDTGVPNAFATGRNPANAAVAVTAGLLNTLNLHEIEGVLAHELGHIVNRDTLITTIVASFAGAIYTVADMLKYAMIFGSVRSDRDRDEGAGAIGYLFIIIVAPIVALLLQMAISRSREYGADHFAAKLSGDADGLMSALIKLDNSNRMPHPRFSSPATATLCIVNPFSGSALFTIFSTHPSTESRVAELRKVRF